MLGLRHYYKSGFTLMEALIVVITIGIILSFAVPAFINAKRKIKDKEAENNLRLIRAAERNYRLDMEQFINCSSPTDCNGISGLGLDLPPCSSQTDCNNKGRWWYYVDIRDSGNNFTATADGQNSAGTQLIGTKNWQINNTINSTVY